MHAQGTIARATDATEAEDDESNLDSKAEFHCRFLQKSRRSADAGHTMGHAPVRGRESGEAAQSDRRDVFEPARFPSNLRRNVPVAASYLQSTKLLWKSGSTVKIRGARDSLVAKRMVSTLRTTLLIAFSAARSASMAGCGDDVRVRNSLSVQGRRRRRGAPGATTCTVADSADWHRVSTMDTRVDLYRWEIADLLDQGQALPRRVRHAAALHDVRGPDRSRPDHAGAAWRSVRVHPRRRIQGQCGVGGVGRDRRALDIHGRSVSGKVSKVFPGQTELGLLEDEMWHLLQDAA